jgi:23S rRNA pseudouridine2605 synthase
VAEERLQRALARAGYGSRRSCEQLIVEGKVTVDERIATLGDKVEIGRHRVEVDGAPVNLDPNVRYYAVHKPAGVVTTMHDPQGRDDIRTLLPSDGPRVFPVGRLDRDTEGLLVLTNDGGLADRLTHPRFGVEKEYLAEVDGVPTPGQVARLRTGVELDDGPAKAKVARIVDVRTDRGQVRVVMTEGRKREVRRMLAAVGLPVTRLVRLRVGPVRLGRMKPGAVRELTAEEVLGLSRAADAPEPHERRRAKRRSPKHGV